MENPDLSPAEWLCKAEAYCARAEHCVADVRRKLLQWGTPSNLYDGIVKKLYELDFLNDSRYCCAYVHDKVAYQSWGRMKIQAGLRTLNLPDKEIREALEKIDKTQYSTNLKYLMQQESKGRSEEQRLRFLLQRGFTYDEIKKCK